MNFKIGDRIFVRGYIDEIRKDTVIVRNDGGYFGTILSEVTGELSSAQPETVRCKDCKLFGNSEQLPSAQPEIIRCKDCKYGEQDEVGRWFCRSLGCQIGNEDGSGYCADAERRTDDSISD